MTYPPRSAGANPTEELAIRYLLAEDAISHPGGSKLGKSNAKIVEVPNTFHTVKVEPARAKRKQFPFQGYIDFQGIKIDVENVKGSTRSGTGPEGDWSIQMFAHYGEVRGTEGTDGDKLDVYVGDNHDSSLVVVVHQHNPWDGKYDEDKVVLGCESVEEAIGLYKKQYDRPGFYRDGEYTAMPIGAFWRWVQDTRNKGKKVKMARSTEHFLVNDEDTYAFREEGGSIRVIHWAFHDEMSNKIMRQTDARKLWRELTTRQGFKPHKGRLAKRALRNPLVSQMGGLGSQVIASLTHQAMEFPTEDALKTYLKEHPGADRKRHTVVENKGGGSGDDSSTSGGGKSHKISPPDGGAPHHVFSAAGDRSVFMGNYTTKHLQTHAQTGKGSVFSGKIKPEDIAAAIDKVPSKFFESGGGAVEVDVPNAGYDLVHKTSEIKKKYPNAKQITVPKQEGVEMGDDGKPKRDKNGKVIPKFVNVTAFVVDAGIDKFATNKMTVIMRPANPQFMPDEAKKDKALSAAVDAKKGFAVLTAFPGSEMPKASAWGKDYAIIVPKGGQGADADVQKALKGGKQAFPTRLFHTLSGDVIGSFR